MSPATTPNPSRILADSSRTGSFTAPRFLLVALLLTVCAVAADQFAATILHSTSPLWAATACLLLVWRRGNVAASSGDPPFEISLQIGRVAAFFALHGGIVSFARSLSGAFQSSSGAANFQGTLLAAGKLSVLVPTLILFPLSTWRKIPAIYFPEAIAGLVVLLTFFPSRILHSAWPWYGQALGRFVHAVSRVFVSNLAYLADSNPTLSGPELDVTIVPECSGINGLELFDYLFGVVALLDWNRLRKDRTLLVYFAGLLAMLFGNAIRIISFVVFGNHGYSESISRFHISAGWIFFSAVFLVYLSMTYGWMVSKRDPVIPIPKKPSKFSDVTSRN
ncbi:MAG TPA: exosortase/archaeosortase family protein [Candidatus Acidoferrum sp.]|nr:exosortase/archaeosortase family protein [Candidatus Acidoferrum sp.]